MTKGNKKQIIPNINYKKFITLCAIILILVAAFVFSIKSKINEDSPVGKVASLIYGAPQTIDCSQKLAQDKHDVLANLLNKKTSVEDCIFTGCSQFFF